jgi:phosphoglycolate phosphatase
MAVSALLFDLDGTLWNSRPWLEAVFVNRLRQSGELVSARLLANVSPITLAREVGVTRNQLVRACADCADELQLYPEVAETLEDFHRRATPMSVATSLARDMVDTVIDFHNLRSFFSVVVTPTRPAQTKADSIRLALDAMALRPTPNTFYVGDTIVDARAADSVGLPFVWASYGYGSAKPENTAIVLDRFSQLLEL